MFTEHNIHTVGDDERLAFSGYEYAARMGSLSDIGGVATSKVTEVTHTDEPGVEEPIKYGTPYTGPDYRDVII